ncbi:hypothetical protein HXX76_007783 [Chlamydomonas incerta]|uniref:Uncharacterized protein n=1 Tax=Chlamydomonas incerta TaxID=51695 RepID=A0A835T7W0_CHLIN|nr:hypothetical protein HXX76_007783 [Chlamydomonas incerta]|eukprot:KAG2434055.1 hypothetical protein HXX76_007783 [Chlamydomonas incerta]
MSDVDNEAGSTSAPALTLPGVRGERRPISDRRRHVVHSAGAGVRIAGAGASCSPWAAAVVGTVAQYAEGAGATVPAAAPGEACSPRTNGASARRSAAIVAAPGEAAASTCCSCGSTAGACAGKDCLPSCPHLQQQQQQQQQQRAEPPALCTAGSCCSPSSPTTTSTCRRRGVRRARSRYCASSALVSVTLLLTAALQGAVLMSGVPCAAAWGWPFGGSAGSSGSASGGSGGGNRGSSSSRSGSTGAARSKSTGGRTSTSRSGGGGAAGLDVGSSSSRSRSNSGTDRAKARREAVSGGGAVWREPAPVLQAAGLRQVSYNPAARDIGALLAWDPAAVNTSADAAATVSLDASQPANYSLPLNDAQSLLRQMLKEEEARRALPYDLTKPYKLPAASYEDEQFVFATGSYPDRYILAQATRSWRHGIRAFIAINNTQDVDRLNEHNQAHRERYEYFPDEGEGDLGPRFHGFMRGDTRAAAAPFMAHEHFGETYKWLLYGDDDTIFYMPAVKQMLAHLDPELPYAISDNLWYRSRHPNLFAPRCLPCHMAVDADPPPPPVGDEQEEDGGGGGEGSGGKAEPITIPSVSEVTNGYGRFLVGARTDADMNHGKAKRAMRTRAFQDWNKTQHQLAEHGEDANVPGLRYAPRPACPFCTREAACSPSPPAESRTGCYPAGGHGGAGMIFSVGLLRRLSAARMKACFMEQFGAPGGDSLLSTCLWREGYAFTDPGTSTLALYDGNYVLFSSEAGKWALHDPLTVLIKGKCDARCKWLIRNAVSHHGRGRHFQGFGQSAAYLYAAAASHRAALKWQAFMAERDLDLKELEASMRGEGAEEEAEEEEEQQKGGKGRASKRSKGEEEGDSTSRRKMHSASGGKERQGGGGGSTGSKAIGVRHQHHSKQQPQHDGKGSGWLGGRKAGGGAAAASKKRTASKGAGSDSDALLASSKTAQAAEALQRGLKAAADTAAGERRVAAQHAAAAERALGVHGGLGSASRSLQGEKGSWEREGESEVGLDYVPHRRGYFDSHGLK